ncbi:MAG: hypothetical protein M1835_005227 [Candelina submexicana]|nr:MAG: hypothetical protein M1835_005227 [Candelina submexicana]
MSFSKEGFNNNIAELQKPTIALDAKIYSKLSKFSKKLKPYATARATKSTDPLNGEPLLLQRQITMPAGQPLDEKKLLRLNQIYTQDQTTANRMLAMLSYHPGHENDTEVQVKTRSCMNRCAIRALITEDTNKSTEAIGLVRSSTNLKPQAAELFEQFFSVCQHPNPAEMVLLARTVRLNPVRVEQWFEDKRKRVFKYYAVKASVCRSGLAGKYLAKKRYEIERQAPRKKKPYTRH